MQAPGGNGVLGQCMAPPPTFGWWRGRPPTYSETQYWRSSRMRRLADIMLTLADVANGCIGEAFAPFETAYWTSDGRCVARLVRVSTCHRLKPVIRTRMGVVLWRISQTYGTGGSSGQHTPQPYPLPDQSGIDPRLGCLMAELHGECDALLAELEDKEERRRERTGGWSLNARAVEDLPCSLTFDAHWGEDIAMALQYHTPLSSPLSVLHAARRALRRPPPAAAVRARATAPLATEPGGTTTDDSGATLPLLASGGACVLTGMGTMDRRQSRGCQTSTGPDSIGTIGRLGGAVPHTRGRSYDGPTGAIAGTRP